jgi:arsenate reductase
VDLSRAEKIKRMVENPKVIERPVVITEQGARIGRPPQQILDLL